MKKFLYTLSVIVSLGLIFASWKKLLPISMVEVLGFISGGWCVWLTVKENIWNWPIGIANSAFFGILFFQSRLFADMGLQVVYIVLGFLGWYWWLYGGKDKTELKVSSVNKISIVILSLITIFSTYGLTIYLRSVNDTAPFWDSFTTVLSLVAQYLLTKKFIENWYVWITADIIYIGLYFYKGLYLTSVLYIIFMCMCFAGLLQWKKSKNEAIMKSNLQIKHV